LNYGTAGFRDKFDLLHSTFVRMGILACLRSQSLGQCIGIMITASHNPECDNGIKIVDGDGGMLAQSWESYAEKLANCSTFLDYQIAVDFIKQAESIIDSRPSFVMIGRDTRPHSLELANCVKAGVLTFGGILIDLEVVTTPQLHYTIQYYNKCKPINHPTSSCETFDSQFYLNYYYNQISQAFVDLKSTCETSSHDQIIVDGSCGVGSISIIALQTTIAKMTTEDNNTKYGLTVDLRNDHLSGPVNEGCGAELVQKNQTPPKGVDSTLDSSKLMCSFDGDADRIVFHAYIPNAQSNVSWILLDGDKIAALISVVLSEEVQASSLGSAFSLGVVQTAYANGASTRFLESRGIPVTIAKTGVKFVHHEATKFDIGIYFEANGHGTVLFSQAFLDALNTVNVDYTTRQALAISRLKACVRLINQSVGDAASDMLMCLCSLQILNMSLLDWHNLYTDLPSRQMKVASSNKSLINCSEDETSALTPVGLQDALNAVMKGIKCGRCFVRPSGTEDVVRVYAEAETQDLADELAQHVMSAINKFLG